MTFLTQQRDLYAYLHDQTLRLLNKGYTGLEIAEMMELPPALERAGTPAATTARSATTSRRSTSITWAGSTATRPSLWEHPARGRREEARRVIGGAEAVIEKAG